MRSCDPVFKVSLENMNISHRQETPLMPTTAPKMQRVKVKSLAVDSPVFKCIQVNRAPTIRTHDHINPYMSSPDT
ncbi:hypothetical protein U0070_010620 [Myodes glareolus]|uniref:Uncharacterized protein n=1 Tax=Myodes glareolus TaxID=447135 RepID=A0AAW0H8P9_MYOGA